MRGLTGGMALMMAACATAPATNPATGDYLSARLAARLNNIDAAAAAFDGAFEATPGNVELARRTYFYKLAAGDVEDATLIAAELLASEESKSDGLPRLALAVSALKKDDLQNAQSLLADDFKEPFIKSVVNLANVWIAAGLNGPQAAITRLDASGEDVFKGFNATHRAILLEMTGDDQLARQAHQVSALGLGGPVGRQAFGAFLERAGDLDAAREYYTVLSNERGPARRMAIAGLQRLDGIDSGRAQPSTAYSNLTASQGTAIALYSFAAALLEQSATERERAQAAGFTVGEPRYNLPLAFAQLSLHLDPELAEARRLIGGVLNSYGDYEAAAAALAPIKSTSNHYEQAQIDIARGYAVAGLEQQAITRLKSMMRRVDNPYEAQYFLAQLYMVEERRDDAVKIVTTALDDLGEDAPDDVWRYYILRGSAHLEDRRWEQAEADFQVAYDLAPEDPVTLNHLGYSWAERGVNLEEAFDLIEKALALEPKSAAITDSLGWAHYQLGQYDDAVEHLETAATLAPDDPTITDHLGDVYWRLGREREASYQWRRVLELDPPSRMRDEITTKLKDGLTTPIASPGASPKTNSKNAPRGAQKKLLPET